MVALSGKPIRRQPPFCSSHMDSNSGEMDILHMRLWSHWDSDVLSGISAKGDTGYYSKLWVPAVS